MSCGGNMPQMLFLLCNNIWPIKWLWVENSGIDSPAGAVPTAFMVSVFSPYAPHSFELLPFYWSSESRNLILKIKPFMGNSNNKKELKLKKIRGKKNRSDLLFSETMMCVCLNTVRALPLKILKSLMRIWNLKWVCEELLVT